MNSFKQFLTEKPNYSKKIPVLISKGMIPITDKIADSLGFGQHTQAFHATRYENLKNIKKLGKSKKAISAFTYGLNRLIGGGLTTTPDVIVKIEGNAVMEFEGDAFSDPDTQGRRWFNPTSGVGKEGKFLNEALLSKTIDKMLDYVGEKAFKLYQSFYATPKTLNDLKNDMLFNSDTFIQIFEFLTGSQKREIIKFYIDNATQLMQNTTYSKIVNKKLKKIKDDKHGYDELIMNKFKVLGVYSLCSGRYRHQPDKAKSEIESLGLKYLGHVECGDFRDVTPETY